MLATTLFSTLALVAGVNALPASGPFAGSSNLYAGVARFDSNDLTRRSYSGDGTFYAAGTGNCGGQNTEWDSIVAISKSLYNSNLASNGWVSNFCNQCISISYNGKTKKAKIVDSCPECAEYDLDMSKSLFTFFADESVGRMKVSWDFAPCDGDNGGDNTTPETPSPTPEEPAPTSSEKPSATPEPSTEPASTPSETPAEPTTTKAPEPIETPEVPAQEPTTTEETKPTTTAVDPSTAPTAPVDPSAAPVDPSAGPVDPSAGPSSVSTTDGPAAPSATDGANTEAPSAPVTTAPTSPATTGGVAPTKTRKCRAKSKKTHAAQH